MTTRIDANGSRFAGQAPATLDELVELLGREPLDRRFEAYGNFAARTDGATRFWGNFLTVSHVFDISSDDDAVVRRLKRAIRANQRRPDYLAQPAPRAK